MPYPTVEQITTSTDSGTTQTVTLPITGNTSGDVFIMFIATDGDNTVSNWNGFTELAAQSDSGGKDAFHAVAYRVSTGDESGTLDITVSSNEKGVHYCWRLSDAGTPEATATNGDTGNPDPPEESHSGGADYYLVIASYGSDDDAATASAYPLADNQDTDVNADPGGCAIAICSANVDETAGDGAYNPGAFTSSDNTEEWVAITTMVPYVAGSTTYTLTPDVDAVLRIARSKGISADTVLHILRTKSISIDALTKFVITFDTNLDAIFRILGKTEAAELDAILRGTKTKGVDLDAVLKFILTRTTDLDSILSVLGFTWGSATITRTAHKIQIWDGWKKATGDPAVFDSSYGKLRLVIGDVFYSPVKDFGDSSARVLAIDYDYYDTGAGTEGTIEWRGSATSFEWDAGSPSWETYTGSTEKTWRYVQLRVSR